MNLGLEPLTLNFCGFDFVRADRVHVGAFAHHERTHTVDMCLTSFYIDIPLPRLVNAMTHRLGRPGPRAASSVAGPPGSWVRLCHLDLPCAYDEKRLVMFQYLFSFDSL